MPRYRVEHKIRTLVENAVGVTSRNTPTFSAEGITFTHWDFDHGAGWTGDAWLAAYEGDSPDVNQAFSGFLEVLQRVLLRVSLIGQAYIEYQSQPFLVAKDGSDIAYLYYSFDAAPVGLMFGDSEKSALDTILGSSRIPEEFYLYWSDAVNAVGYSSKLLLMFSAIEALVKKPNGKQDFVLKERILGKGLIDKIYAQKVGLRNRLVHGEYLSPTDVDDYVTLVHKKIIRYVNDEILHSKLVEEDVTHPQRNFYDNTHAVGRWIQQADDAWPLTLKKVLESSMIVQSDVRLDNYRTIYDKVIYKDF